MGNVKIKGVLYSEKDAKKILNDKKLKGKKSYQKKVEEKLEKK